MPNDDFTPDLSKLDKDYQILTELHSDGESRTYLARHLQLNRDVTITVVRGLADDDGNVLTHFAADARLLTTMRNPHVVPVIEGIWLDETTLAVVRARVRGSTLEQLIRAVGPMPITRVAPTIRDVNEAMTWARTCGVVHRHIHPRDIVYQQGSGRLLLSFERGAIAADALPDEADDAHTIGQLAADMLSGEIGGQTIEPTSGVVLAQEIDPSVADAIESARRARRDDAVASVARLISALDASAAAVAPTTADAGPAPIAATPVATAAVSEAAPVSERIVPPVIERAADVRRRVPPKVALRTGVPVVARDDAVVVVKPSFGFNARMGTAIAVAAIIGVLGLLVFQRGDPSVSRLASADSSRTAAGEVAPRTSVDSSAMVGAPSSRGATGATIGSPSTPPVTSPGSIPSSTAPVIPRSPITPPDTPRHEPLKTAPPSTMPLPTTIRRDTAEKKTSADSAAEAERKFKRDSAADVADVCLSPESADQHKCLMNAIDRNDRELNGVYARLIAALRRQAGAASADPDPDTVEELRAGQRKWVDERDVACRNVGEGPLYAKSRSACFAQQSADRARELKKMLDAIPPNL